VNAPILPNSGVPNFSAPDSVQNSVYTAKVCEVRRRLTQGLASPIFLLLKEVKDLAVVHLARFLASFGHLDPGIGKNFLVHAKRFLKIVENLAAAC
jgi:hypothetical protein